MKRHEPFTPMEYKHERLMWDLNEFMIDINAHLFNIPVKRSKPDLSEIDNLTQRLMAALKEGARPMIRR